jgi:hypothetical protein
MKTEFTPVATVSTNVDKSSGLERLGYLSRTADFVLFLAFADPVVSKRNARRSAGRERDVYGHALRF